MLLPREEVPMAKTVYLSTQGDDKNDDLTDETPVRTGAKANAARASTFPA
jgi:hypothetical protein